MSKEVSTQTLIDMLRFKANNIKAHIEPEFFNDVADRLEKYEKYKLALYKVVKLNKVMPVGLTIGKTNEEIIDMSKKTMEELLKQIDFEYTSKDYYGY